MSVPYVYIKSVGKQEFVGMLAFPLEGKVAALLTDEVLAQKGRKIKLFTLTDDTSSPALRELPMGGKPNINSYLHKEQYEDF